MTLSTPMSKDYACRKLTANAIEVHLHYVIEFIRYCVYINLNRGLPNGVILVSAQNPTARDAKWGLTSGRTSVGNRNGRVRTVWRAFAVRAEDSGRCARTPFMGRRLCENGEPVGRPTDSWESRCVTMRRKSIIPIRMRTDHAILQIGAIQH